MQFGMPTLIETKSIESCAALCHELGLDFVELNMNLPEYQAERLDVERLGDIADKYGIYYTIHIDENLNPCDFNERVAAAYTETVLQTIEAAKQLSVPVLNMHLNNGVYFTLPTRKVFLFEEYESEYFQKLTAFRDVCTAAIGGADIKICVENGGGDFAPDSFTRKGLDLLLKSQAFALTFDIGHNASHAFADEPTIMECVNRLFHMHIHDACDRSNHLPLGEGELDLAKYLDLARTHDCRAVLEVKTAAGCQKSVNWLKVRGYICEMNRK
jgi:sugar phosphate isomerase/epimerase